MVYKYEIRNYIYIYYLHARLQKYDKEEGKSSYTLELN
jgi:hypothetical protein